MSAKRVLQFILSSRPPQKTDASKRLISSLLISLAAHMAILFVLSFIYFVLPNNRMMDSILVLMGTDTGAPGDGIEIDLKGSKESDIEIGESEAPMEMITPQLDIVLRAPLTTSESTPNMTVSRDDSRAAPAKKNAAVKAPSSTKSSSASKAAARKGASTGAEMVHGDHFQGRGGMNKAALLKRMGGTDESEAAVKRGLRWLKNHQLHGGAWSFDHRHSPECDCTMPGLMENNLNAATAMALLAFLGAGQTNEAGDYQKEVQKGIDFLLAHATRTEYGTCFFRRSRRAADFLHSRTGDNRTQRSVCDDGRSKVAPGNQRRRRFSDRDTGSWRRVALFSRAAGRYFGRRLATDGLKECPVLENHGSAKGVRGCRPFHADRFINARLAVCLHAQSQRNAVVFDDSRGSIVQDVLDWKDNGGLQAGIRILDEHGPEPDDMYYNYYATQVMHHWGGPEWDRWNKIMREHLIQTQMHVGHCTGSWNVADPHGTQGGRLYMTTLALLTLEVYYRHLPLYQKDRIEIPLMNQATEVKAK